MPTGDFPPPKGMRWTDAHGWIPDLPPDWGKINGEDHPDTIVADASTAAERERCALIVEQMQGFKTHKFRRRVVEAIRNPQTFYERR